MTTRDLTFLPPDGTFNYNKKKHYKDLHASTPIPLHKIPKLLMDGFFDGYHPPRLWCGWPLGDDGAAKLFEKHFPQEATYDEDGDLDTIDAIGSLRKRLYEHFQIPPEDQTRILLPDMGDENGRPVIMLCVGWNDVDFSPFTEYIELFQHRLFEGKEPQWYLSAHKFGWTKDKESKTETTVEEMVAFIRGVNEGIVKEAQTSQATST